MNEFREAARRQSMRPVEELVSAKIVKEVCGAWEPGVTIQGLARQFDLTPETIGAIIQRAIADELNLESVGGAGKFDRVSEHFRHEFARKYDGLFLDDPEIDLIIDHIRHGQAEIISTMQGSGTLYVVHAKHTRWEGPLFVRADENYKLITVCDPAGFDYTEHRGWELKPGWKPPVPPEKATPAAGPGPVLGS